MRLTSIEVWGFPSSGHQTFLRRYYTNPDMDHTVALYPKEVVTYTFKDNSQQPFKTGIHHMARPL